MFLILCEDGWTGHLHLVSLRDVRRTFKLVRAYRTLFSCAFCLTLRRSGQSDISDDRIPLPIRGVIASEDARSCPVLPGVPPALHSSDRSRDGIGEYPCEGTVVRQTRDEQVKSPSPWTL